MTGYLDDPEATAAAIDADGWLHTGDLGSMDERGYCRIGGRLKDMIIRGGENIYPREIEQVLFEHEDVADVAVVGVPDPVWGEQVAAVVRPAAGRTPDPDVLFAYCRARLAPHKAPRHWRVVDAFPLTPSGKIKKYVLRDELIADLADSELISGPGHLVRSAARLKQMRNRWLHISRVTCYLRLQIQRRRPGRSGYRCQASSSTGRF
jgi:acyl-CoA synthetase (AMP-forming)/AMP-acid ligase II